MVAVTGGAGFIGSALVWRLNAWGRADILVTDVLDTTEKWKNLRGLSFSDYLDKTAFIERLESGSFGDSIDTILHMGACSSTTETDTAFLMENNYRYTVRLGEWWEKHPSVRFIYASSAATYGDGGQGYHDDEDALEHLRPLNMYGFSKHLFDLHARAQGWLGRMVGLKFFNVFGPNENHKGDMRSVVNKAYPGVRDEGVARLFKSYRPEYSDGGQVRDFIYVKDAVEMTLFFMDHPKIGGLYNIGTGVARSWNDLARALFAAVGKPPRIEYIPMPENIRPKYQYRTEADLSKLRRTGCIHQCLSLEDAVADYVRAYLGPQRLLGDAS